MTARSEETTPKLEVFASHTGITTCNARVEEFVEQNIKIDNIS